MPHPSRSLSLVLPIILCGCAAMPEAPEAAMQNPWYAAGQAELNARLDRELPGDRATNIILFIGDGLDVSTVTAARILEGQLRGEHGEENSLSFESFPFTGLAKTYNTNQQTPDSAGTATAMLSGVKTRAGVIGLSGEVKRGDCAGATGKSLTTLLDLAEDAGRATGIVTNTRITHATPAAAFAHAPERDWESDAQIPMGQQDCPDIASQLVDFDRGDGPDVIMGGGRRYFMTSGQADPEYPDRRGHRADGRDLIAAWQAHAGPGGRFVWNSVGLARARAEQPEKLLALFDLSHMRFEADRPGDPGGEPSLAEMTTTAIELLLRDPDGFFLMVEAGRIDHAHHDGNAYRALTETIELSRAVHAAMALTSERDTLIIVTSDHGHTLRIAGYATRGNPILGMVTGNDASGEPLAAPRPDLTGRPYTTLGYLNGPGYQGASDTQPEGPKRWPHDAGSAKPLAGGRSDLSAVDVSDPDYLQEAGIPTFGGDLGDQPALSETHSGGDVPVYATGPGARLLSGVYEQNFIFHVMRFAGGL